MSIKLVMPFVLKEAVCEYILSAACGMLTENDVCRLT
jgi:hypothetical protein